MKNKKTLSAIFAVAIITLAGYNTCLKERRYNASALVLENIEALADDGEGTSASYCYLKLNYSSISGLKKFCDERTNSTTIYPCPRIEEPGYYSDIAKDRCLNK